jgi:hypothetical protein
MYLILTGACCCREILFGGLWVCQPSRLPCAVQGDQVPSSRVLKEPQGKEELFNYAHSSLRNCIERAFGVLKQKWRILVNLLSYPIQTQTHIIVACMALHNFIRLSGLRDHWQTCPFVQLTHNF